MRRLTVSIGPNNPWPEPGDDRALCAYYMKTIGYVPDIGRPLVFYESVPSGLRFVMRAEGSPTGEVSRTVHVLKMKSEGTITVAPTVRR